MASPLFQYALRTDKSFPEVKTFLETKGISGWAVREVAGDNEHWHWFLESSMKAQPFRVALTRAVPALKGNASYSVSEVQDKDKYLRYMAKGESDGAGPEVVWRVGPLWSDEKLEELHVEFWSENRKLRKRKCVNVVDAVIDKCKADGTAWDDRRTIIETYLREVASRDKPINLYAVKSGVNLVQVKLCPDDKAILVLANEIQ